MKKALSARSEITIHAPAVKVWDALTTPSMIKEYMYGTKTVSRWKVGSPIVFRGNYNGKSYEDKGEILQIEPKKLLQYTHFSSLEGKPDVPENYRTVTFRLRPGAGKTMLSVTQNKVEDEKGRVEARKNWASVLAGIKKLLER